MIILLILAVLYLYLNLFIARKIEKKNIELLEYRFKQIKNSLRKILEELDDMQESVPVDRTKQICRDIYHKWLFEGKEEE
ncbi:MAG: hypothetical protein IIY81_04930 [Lachnospiraceae bacterium]|nr:hypothetical protein [Lachnospiraceae bacterium]